ncbi:hypothetical protein [Sinosporangium siamense]|uniref:Abi-like protein n=1 Tax=Sinosporangium siamense TaxID=1367973 RepID=A0A919V9Z9_9ACTN|nr:hypothetical protein [Sinosporangium siamense]GII95896.1 hypothetical protein Ssi02_61270 [Sinosporangium siamense]
MHPELPGWVERVISIPRFAPYLDALSGNRLVAWDLYQWNVQVSEAFYGPLNCLEICLRNAEHDRLRNRFGTDDWWRVAPLDEYEAAKVTAAKQKLARKGVSLPSADDVVTELSFGFWVSLLSRRYDRRLWVPALHRAFPYYSGRREALRDNLQTMVLLRNRIMHHEPIHHRHLTADHAKIYRLLDYVEPQFAGWLRAFDRVPAVLTRRPERTRH